MAGILSQGTGMSGGVLSRQPQSLFDRLGFDVSSPQNQVALAFANNIIGSPDSSPFAGVAAAANQGQQMQARKVELSQIVKKQRQEDDQSAQLKQMLAGDPMATQFLLAGQPDEAMKIYAHNKGLDATPAGLMNVNGHLVNDQTGAQVADYSTPDKGPALPASYQEFQLAQKDPAYAASLASSSTKPPTADQSNAAGFADRMTAAEPIIDATTQAQTDWGQATKNSLGNMVGAGNFLVSEDYQKALQAQRDFVNAILRKESGAAISDGEFKNAQQQYFPQPGDTPAVIDQKRDNRRIAIDAMKRSGATALARSGQQAGTPDYKTKYGLE